MKKQYRILILDQTADKVLINKEYESVSWVEGNEPYPEIHREWIDISGSNEIPAIGSEEDSK
jgi:hypothetical protein